MNRFKIFDFLHLSSIDIDKLPIDSYFLQKRIKKRTNESKENITTEMEKEIQPNILGKYQYSGFYHACPTHPLSQIINHEKLINIEDHSE